MDTRAYARENLEVPDSLNLANPAWDQLAAMKPLSGRCRRSVACSRQTRLCGQHHFGGIDGRIDGSPSEGRPAMIMPRHGAAQHAGVGHGGMVGGLGHNVPFQPEVLADGRDHVRRNKRGRG